MDRRRALLLALLVATGLCGPANGGEGPEAVGAGPGASPTEPAPLAREGERMGDATVAGLVEHREFVRILLRLADGRSLAVEIKPLEIGHRPACAVGELGVYPRWEQLGEAVEIEAQPPGVLAVCERLRAQAGELRLRRAPADVPYTASPDEAPAPASIRTAEGGLPVRGLLIGVVLSIGLGGLLGVVRALQALRGDRPGLRDLALVSAISLGARLLLSPRTVFIGPDAGYEALTIGWGTPGVHPLYGGGFGALMAPAASLWPQSASALFTTQLCVASLAAPLLFGLVRLCLPGPTGRFPALVAGLALALLPVHLRLSATEVMTLPLPTLELGALVAAAVVLRGGSPAWALLSALCTGLVPNVRPEAATFLPVGLGALLYALHRRRGEPAVWLSVGVASAVGLTLFALRFTALPPLDEGGPTSLSRMFSLRTLGDVLLPTLAAPSPAGHAGQVFLNPRYTPALLPLLAVAALWSPRRRLVSATCGWLLFMLLPVLPKDSPTADAWRLQLPALVPGLLLSALGAEEVVRRHTARVRPALLGGLLLLPLAWVPWIRQPWATHAEWALLQEALPTLPANTTLLVADRGSHPEKVIEVLSALAPQLAVEPMSPWLARPGPHQSTFAWVGVVCHLARVPGREKELAANPCAGLQERCRLTPWKIAETEARGDTDLEFDAPHLSIGLYRIDACTAPGSAPPVAAPSPGPETAG